MNSGAGRADVLLCASHAADFAGLRGLLGDQLGGVVRGIVVRTKVVGFGLAAAAASTARGILATTPRIVLHVGTVGIYQGLTQYKPCDTLVARSTSLIDHSVMAGHAAFPDPMSTLIETNPTLSAGVAHAGAGRAFAARIATTVAPTLDDAISRQVPGLTNLEGENGEAFAIATACKASEVPFTSVLGVTHMVGSTGRGDFAQFHREAVNQVGRVLTEWLHGGAQGMPHGGS